MLGIEPGAAGKEASMLPLCYAAPLTYVSCTGVYLGRSESDRGALSGNTGVLVSGEVVPGHRVGLDAAGNLETKDMYSLMVKVFFTLMVTIPTLRILKDKWFVKTW